MSLILSGTDGVADVDGSAASPAIRGTDANTGIYFPGADRIGFSIGGVQVGEFDASGNFLFNSGYGSTAVAYGCRAWVNFNGTGTVAIRASGNVSSITDNGTGDYTVNFTTAMPDENYAAQVTNQSTFFSGNAFSTTAAISESAGSISTTSIRVVHIPAGDVTGYSGALNDSAVMCVSIFR
jgi:hypothetical protein